MFCLWLLLGFEVVIEEKGQHAEDTAQGEAWLPAGGAMIMMIGGLGVVGAAAENCTCFNTKGRGSSVFL